MDAQRTIYFQKWRPLKHNSSHCLWGTNNSKSPFTLNVCVCLCVYDVILLTLFSVVLFTLSDGKCRQTSKQIIANTNANAQCERALMLNVNFQRGISCLCSSLYNCAGISRWSFRKISTQIIYLYFVKIILTSQKVFLNFYFWLSIVIIIPSWIIACG